MRPQRAAALHDLGLVLAVPAVLAGTAVVVAVVSGEWFALPGLALAVALSGGAGGAAVAVARRAPSRTGGMTRAWMVAGWFGASLLAAVPFWAVGLAPEAGSVAAAYADPVNAVFEGVSGLTSTGLTVATDASALPRTLQWWRSALQWVGGVGVLYLALGFAPSDGESETTAASEEMDTEAAPGGGAHSIRTVWAIYAGYTVAAVVAFWAAGMPPWEALNHALTAIATGGFTVTSDSFQSYGPAVLGVAVVVMLLGAVSFALHALVVVRGRVGEVGRDAQVRLLGALWLAGPLALGLALGGGAEPLAVVFQWTSALTTSGFAVVDEAGWPAAALVLTAAVMVAGASSGSTVGGVKLKRAALLASAGWARARGRRPVPLHVDGEAEGGAEEVAEAARVALAFAVTFGVGVALLVGATGAPLAQVVFEAASALGTVGLSTGLTGPDLPAPARLVLTALMWLGRLEVVAVVALVAAAARPAQVSG